MEMTITSLSVDFQKREVKAKADFKGKNAKGTFDGTVDLDFDALENVVRGAIVSEFLDQHDPEVPEGEPVKEPQPSPVPDETPADEVPDDPSDIDALLNA